MPLILNQELKQQLISITTKIVKLKNFLILINIPSIKFLVQNLQLKKMKVFWINWFYSSLQYKLFKTIITFLNQIVVPTTPKIIFNDLEKRNK